MAVVGSTVTIDIHSNEQVGIGSIRDVVRQEGRVHPTLSERVADMAERSAARVLDNHDVPEAYLTPSVRLVDDEIRGVPRERIVVALDVEGEKETLAAVDSAFTMPARAEVAQAVEEPVNEFLEGSTLGSEVRVTVSVTPVEFR